ncbi:MAG: hypothetical protein ABI217_06260 [Chthoniobacterales bacterium]
MRIRSIMLTLGAIQNVRLIEGTRPPSWTLLKIGIGFGDTSNVIPLKLHHQYIFSLIFLPSLRRMTAMQVSA